MGGIAEEPLAAGGADDEAAVGFSLGLLVLNRPYLSAYDDTLGQAVLALVGGCYAAAYWWITKASQADRSDRFLTGAAWEVTS